MQRHFLSALAAGLAASLASAQTNISGALSDSTTGPLGPGVYHCTGSISVPLGQTLTVAAGAVIKFGLDQLFTIDGTLLVNGASGNAVYFTDINDDTVGGDSNGNGAATTPGSNWWRGLVFNGTSDASALANFEVRYGGRNFYAGIEIFDSDLTLAAGTVRNCQVAGIDLNNTAARPAISGCALQNNVSAAIVGVQLDSVPGFANNTATGNGGDYLALSSATLATDPVIGPSDGINGVIYVPVNISVPAGRQLTLQAGTILKFGLDNLVTIDGTLTVNGAAGNRVYFTDIADDSVGGDTNTNGASSGAANWWRGIVLNTSSSSLSHFELRYGGRNFYAGIEILSASPTLSNGTVRDCAQQGIDLNATAAYPSISNCSVQGCANYAIRGVRLDAIPGFVNNTASGNTNDLIEASVGTIALNTTIGPANGIGGVVYLPSGASVPAGTMLALQAGTILKFGVDNIFNVAGTLNVTGGSASKVIFTDVNDDVGGNTNGSATAPGANWWRGLVFAAGSSASSLSHFEVRYGGRNFHAGIEITDCSPTLSNGLVRDMAQSGIDLNGSGAYPSISSCSIQNCQNYAIRGVRLDAIPGFSNNTATGCTNNLIEANPAAIAQDTTIGPADGINGVVYLPGGFSVPLGKTLSLQAGTIFKFNVDNLATVDGTLIATGTSVSNVIFTDLADDAAGGDTNGNGASSGAANWWRGIQFNSTADASSLDFCELRYGGRNFVAGIEIHDADVTLTRSTVRNCAQSGIDLNSTAAKPRINRCLLQGNVTQAITGVQIDSVPYITRNTAVGNGLNQMLVTTGTPAADLYLQGGLGVNDVIVMGTSIYVPAGIRLRMGPGAAIKLNVDQLVTIDGALDVEGTAAKPVILTDYNDDSIGGDSNGNGASTGSANWWRGVVFGAGAAASRVEYLNVRFCGRNFFAGINCASPLVELWHCRVDSTAQQGFILSAAARVDFLVARLAGSTGIRLDGGAFDLRHATVWSCSTGVQKNGGAWTGSVVDTCAWANTTNYSGLSAAEVRYSDGFVGGVGNINADPLFVDAPNGDLHLQAGSPCIGTGDPFSELDADCTGSDIGAYPALGVAQPFTYCVGKANSAGCVPFMTFSGFASTSSSDPFLARAYNVLNNKNGLFFYGLSGPTFVPFQGGTKCVAPPTLRLPIQGSGGSAVGTDCSGSYAFDFNAHIQSGLDPQLVAGATVNVQCWYRDPAVPSATGLSDGLQFDVCN